MARIPNSIGVTGLIAPTDSDDKYPVIDPLYGIDGLRNVLTMEDMYNIPIERRREGMIVGVMTNKTYWRLKRHTEFEPWIVGNPDNWELFAGVLGVSYEQLLDMCINSKLTPLKWYAIYDYKSVNFLHGYDIALQNPNPQIDNFNPRDIFISEPEFLLVRAITNSEISPICYSLKYPKDIIYYDIFYDKIGVEYSVYNGATLPNGENVDDFSIQWDDDVGKSYIKLPFNYYFVYGALLSIELNHRDYGTMFTLFDRLKPYPHINKCDYKNNSPLEQVIIDKNDRGKIYILTDYPYETHEQYFSNTSLKITTIFPLNNAYGLIRKRIDTERNIEVDFDFRNVKFRRYYYNFTDYNVNLMGGYYGIGDRYLNLTPSGDYMDCNIFNTNNVKNVKINLNNSYFDASFFNTVFFCDSIFNLYINGFHVKDNTISSPNILNMSINNIVGSFFLIKNSINNININNSINNIVYCNSFENNNINSIYNSNIIAPNTITNNKINSIDSSQIYTDLNNNDISSDLKNVIINNRYGYGNFQYNKIDVNLYGVDFTNATHVFNSYNCTIVNRINNNPILYYFDSSGIILFDGITN